MSSRASYAVDQREDLGAKEFAREYVALRRPVVLKQALAGCSAVSRWTLDYLRVHAGDLVVPLKTWKAREIKTTVTRLDEYADALEQDEHARCDAPLSPGGQLAYLHDIPLKLIFPRADQALEAFPKHYFPSWYRPVWADFAQFFLGPKGSVTPLHFDCLLTHNLFFQVVGRKRFLLIPPEQLECCYPYNWRWCKVDAENPDLESYPNFRNAEVVGVVLLPGDALYFPPGTLHHVRSLDTALSFNVDWHTRGSVIAGLGAACRGMPAKNVYYNTLIAAGLCLGVSPQRIYPLYRSYLDYVS